jgi:hypothetical protein
LSVYGWQLVAVSIYPGTGVFRQQERLKLSNAVCIHGIGEHSLINVGRDTCYFRLDESLSRLLYHAYSAISQPDRSRTERGDFARQIRSFAGLLVVAVRTHPSVVRRRLLDRS